MLGVPVGMVSPAGASASPGAVVVPSNVSLQVPAPTPLSRVTNVTAKPASPYSVALSWINPVTSSYKGVTIRRATGTTPPATVTSGRAITNVATPGTTVTNPGLSDGITYSYSLFAYDGAGNYAAPATVTVTTPVDAAAAPTLSEQRASLRSQIEAAKQDYVNARPFVSLLARADGLALKSAIDTGVKTLDQASLLVTNAQTRTAMDAAAAAVATEAQRASTTRTSGANLKAARDLRAVQQEVAREALANLENGSITQAAYEAIEARAAAFTTLLAADTKSQLGQLGKTVKPVSLQAAGWRDELEQNIGTIPTAAGWVGFAGGCALPAADPTFRPQLPTIGPGVATNAQQVASAKARGEAHATLKPIHEQMLRSATTQAGQTLSLDQLRSGFVPRIARLGYGWLEAGDTASRDKLRTETRQLLEAGSGYSNSLTTSHLLLAASTAADWSELSGMEETVQVDWLGTHTCLHADRENFVDAPTNIAAIHNSASFVASAVFLEDSPEQAAALAKESLTSIQPALQMILTDGGTKEGPGYWTYQSRALATLYSTLPNAYTSMPIAMPSIAKVSDYAMNSTGPDRLPTPFADAAPEKLSPLMPAWDAYSRNDPAVGAWVERELKEKPDAYLMWWYTTPSTIPARKSSVYPYTGFAALHASTTTATLKGGDNAANHAHLDLGTVSLFRGGIQWSVDPGGELGSPSGYYSDPTRWGFWKPGTSAHSTLSIAGANQPVNARAGVSLPSSSTATVNLLQALPGTTSATRTLRHAATQSVVTDTVRATTALPLQWQWVTDAQVVVEPALKRATLKKNGKQIVITFTGVPAGSTLSAVAAPGTGPDGAPLKILKLVTPKVTSLNLVATIK